MPILNIRWHIAGWSESLAAWAFPGLMILGHAGAVFAQEAVRMSMAGEAAAEARLRAAADPDYYNLKLGLALWRFGAGLGLAYNDNVSYQNNDAEGDLILQPNFTTRLLWPVSDQNSLNLNLGAGYSAYLDHGELSQFYVSPGSELAFDVYVGDLWVNLHDRISISELGYQDPTVAATGDSATLENAAGITGVWDLNKVNLRLTYDHANYLSLGGSDSSQPDRGSEVFSASAGYAPKVEMLMGIQVGGSLVDYDMNGGDTNWFSSAVQWNAGAFYEARVSDYIRIRTAAGYTVFTPDNGGPNEVHEGESDLTGGYGQFEIRHEVNQYVDYALSAGRNISYAFFSGTADVYYARLNANWKFLRKITLTTSVDYDAGTQFDTSGLEDFTRYGGGISVNRRLAEKMSGSLNYRYYVRDSDVPERSYRVSIVSLSLNYTL